MFTTSFLALWMANNTSAAIMMLPITLAVVKELIKLDKTYELDIIKAGWFFFK